MPFQDYKQFMDLCDQSTKEDKAKMVELYLHNMALIDMNVWDPNSRLGDMQLMAMASWMNHEELRVAEIKNNDDKRAEWAINDKSWAIISHGTHQHTQPACQ